MNNKMLTGLFCVIAVYATSGLATPAFAGNIGLVDLFKNQDYIQTSGAAPTTPTGFFADVELTSVNPGDFDDVMVTFPGPASPVDIPQVSPTFFSYGPGFATQADMDAAIPTGDYDYTGTNSSTSDSETATLNYTGDAFTSAIPALNAATWNALNGLDPSMALTLGFNSFTPAANANQAFTFFTISDASGAVFTGGFLDPSTMSLLLPANKLMANTTYNFELDFSDRQNGSDPVSGDFTLIGSDVRDDGTFTTGAIAPATPEPGTLLLLGSGIFALGLARRRVS